MRKNRIITHKIKRGSLIHFALDGIKRESFDVIKTELASLLKKRAGVYALYQNDKLVRVGLGTNIYWRLKGHSKSPAACWLASRQGSGAAHLATRGAESAAETAAPPKIVAERWIVRAAVTSAGEAGVELRLRKGDDTRRQNAADADADRRIHPRVPGDPCSQETGEV